MTAFLVKPPSKGPFPGVILVHGAGGNERPLFADDGRAYSLARS
jgi:dienelactone hydrolase